MDIKKIVTSNALRCQASQKRIKAIRAFDNKKMKLGYKLMRQAAKLTERADRLDKGS